MSRIITRIMYNLRITEIRVELLKNINGVYGL